MLWQETMESYCSYKWNVTGVMFFLSSRQACVISSSVIINANQCGNWLLPSSCLTNYHIEKIGFTIVKDFKKDTIYIFIVSFVKGAARTCQNPWIDLQNFGFEVKRIL